MRRAIVLLVLIASSLAMYAVGVIMMLSTSGVNEIPTPGFGVVGGVVAMFATVGVFAAGSICYPAALLVDEGVSRVTANVLCRYLG